jgi:hypothetical protein
MMVVRNKARREMREAAFAGKNAPGDVRPPGRPPGTLPLAKSDLGREVAVFGWLRRTRCSGKGGATRAATIAAGIFNKGVEAAVSTITTPEGHVGFSYLYTRGRGAIEAKELVRGGSYTIEHNREDRDEARTNRVRRIRSEAPKLIKNAVNAAGDDAVWLEASMLALDVWFNAMALGNNFKLRGAIEVLERLGWTETLRRLIP